MPSWWVLVLAYLILVIANAYILLPDHDVGPFIAAVVILTIALAYGLGHDLGVSLVGPNQLAWYWFGPLGRLLTGATP